MSFNTSASQKRANEPIDLYKDLPFVSKHSSDYRFNSSLIFKKKIGQSKRIRISSSAPSIPTYVTSRLQTSDPGGMYASRVQGRQILLENPARESRATKELKDKKLRQKAEKEKKKKGTISKREAKAKGVWRLDETQAKYVEDNHHGMLTDDFIYRFDLFLPLHHLWMGYMSELLGLAQKSSSTSPTTQLMPPAAGMHPKLVKADFHGSIMTGMSHR